MSTYSGEEERGGRAEAVITIANSEPTRNLLRKVILTWNDETGRWERGKRRKEEERYAD